MGPRKESANNSALRKFSFGFPARSPWRCWFGKCLIVISYNRSGPTQFRQERLRCLTLFFINLSCTRRTSQALHYDLRGRPYRQGACRHRVKQLFAVGLVDNLEFNVDLKNRADYEFALAKFNELWAQAVEVSETYVETVELRSPFAQFTPHELFLKFLYDISRLN